MQDTQISMHPVVRTRPTRRRTPRWYLATSLVAALVLVACGGDGNGDAETTPPDDGGATAEDGDFDADLVAAAQDEGELVMYLGGHTRESAELLAASFEERFDISVTFVRDTTGAVIDMVESELTAGAVSVDIASLNDEATFMRWDDEDVITAVDLPNRDEILDDLDDGSSPYLTFAWQPMGILYNEDRLPAEDVPASWEDLTADGFDGVLAHADPGASGAALGFVTALEGVLGESFFEDLGTAEVLISDSALAITQFVVTGEADFGLPGIESDIVSARAGGEPVEMVYPEEGVPLLKHLVGALTEAPNPNAAELLLHYHFSEEWQSLAAQEVGDRGSLESAELPEGRPAADDLNLIIVDIDELQEAREFIPDLFDRHLR